MHKLTAAILAAIASLRNVALDVRQRVLDMHVSNLKALHTTSQKEVAAAEYAKKVAVDAYAFACKEIAEADEKVRDTVTFIKAEAAKHGVTLEV
jgi:plastocyanin